MKHAIFLIQTYDRCGVLAEITKFFSGQNVNILNCSQYTDEIQKQYFMRIVVDINEVITRKNLETSFANIAKILELKYSIHYTNTMQRVAIMVSKTSHCLYDLLTHSEETDLNFEIPLIISNHPDMEAVAERFQVPYYFFPIENGDKELQEDKILEILQRHHIDLVVMARYMQVLSGKFIKSYPERIINIHHAFLPAFQGGNPYQRAWQRGVKMIGATAHYATEQLDEGPIIEQDVERINHEETPESMRKLGRDIERRVLTRAVRAHLEHRVICNGVRTIVFSK